MRKLCTVLVFVLALVTQLAAQTRTVRGKITDDKGASLAGASILVKGTTIGTNSGADGTFSLNVPSSAKTLVIRSLGFAQQEVTIGNGAINVSMKAATDNLEEVVVTGYSREKKSSFTGASSIISSKAIETVPVGSFDQALQGRAPGVLVNSGSGQPGATANVTIRGISSVQAAGVQPLYVLDGIPLPAGDFATLNPNDFESVTVLKDASASALYGARGGLGVIVITTKKGKAGTNNFQFRTQFGFTQKPDFSRLNLMSTKEMLQYEEREKIPSTPGWVYSPLNPAIPAGMTAATKQRMLDSIGGIDVNYTDIFYRQGISQTYEMSMSGGTEKTRYFVSGSVFNQEGIDLNSYLKRYTVRFNIDHSTDKLFVQLNSTIGYSKNGLAEGDVYGNSPRNPFQMTYRAKTYENPYKADGSLNWGANSPLALKQIANLLEGMQNSSRRSNQIKINAGLNIGYKILPSLTLSNRLGIDVNSSMDSRYINANSYIGSLQLFQSGLAQEAANLTSQLINTTSLVYSKRYNNMHDVEVGAYFETVRGYQKGLGLTLYNLDPRLTETGQGAGTLPTNGATTYPQTSSSAKSGFGIRSFFGTLRYTFNSKYTVTANIRRDGTSRIVNLDNREITTWAAGATWNAMQENFMRSQSFFTDLKVRASYGIVPNIGSVSTSNYSYPLSTPSSVPNYQGTQIPTFGTTTYVGSPITGLAPSTPGNPNLRIEKVQKYNIGVDFAIWKNRARFSIDAYLQRTIDLFVNQPISGTSGFNNGPLAINAGKMRNKGLDITASVDVVKSKDLLLTLGINHNLNYNKIEDLGLVSEYVTGTSIIRTGIAYGTAYTYNYLGADPATGRPRYLMTDGKSETFDIGKAGQFAFGSYLPVNQGGFTIDLRYKAFSLSTLFSYQFDVWRYDNTYNWISRGTPGYHQSVRASKDLITEQWTKPGDVKKFQASVYDRGFTSSDLWDAKFMRLRNVTLSYQIPQLKTAAGTVLIKSSRFYIQAQNLAIWSPWKGLDPEDSNNISLNEYPNPKYFVVGLDINF